MEGGRKLLSPLSFLTSGLPNWFHSSLLPRSSLFPSLSPYPYKVPREGSHCAWAQRLNFLSLFSFIHLSCLSSCWYWRRRKGISGKKLISFELPDWPNLPCWKYLRTRKGGFNPVGRHYCSCQLCILLPVHVICNSYVPKAAPVQYRLIIVVAVLSSFMFRAKLGRV
jgi:hypothetical protein